MRTQTINRSLIRTAKTRLYFNSRIQRELDHIFLDLHEEANFAIIYSISHKSRENRIAAFSKMLPFWFLHKMAKICNFQTHHHLLKPTIFLGELKICLPNMKNHWLKNCKNFAKANDRILVRDIFANVKIKFCTKICEIIIGLTAVHS